MLHAGHPARLRALGSLLLLPLLPGCAAFRSRFPSHEDVFKPVPLTIGQLRVEGTDSVYVLAGRGFEIVAPSREILADAERSVDAVGRSYVRYFEAEPRPIVVRMQLMSRNMSREARDSVARLRRQAPQRDARGRPVVIVPVFRLEDRRGMGPTGGGETPMFGFADAVVAQAWVDAYADTGDSATAAAGTGARPRRLPDWLAAGAAGAISASPFNEFAIAWLSDHEKELIPLRALFDSARATPARLAASRLPDDEDAADDEQMQRMDQMSGGRGGMMRGGRRGVDAFSTQSLAVVQFLATREDPALIGRLAARLARGDRMTDALSESRKLPHDLDALDTEFRTWLEERGKRIRRRG